MNKKEKTELTLSFFKVAMDRPSPPDQRWSCFMEKQKTSGNTLGLTDSDVCIDYVHMHHHIWLYS